MYSSFGLKTLLWSFLNLKAGITSSLRIVNAYINMIE